MWPPDNVSEFFGSGGTAWQVQESASNDKLNALGLSLWYFAGVFTPGLIVALSVDKVSAYNHSCYKQNVHSAYLFIVLV